MREKKKRKKDLETERNIKRKIEKRKIEKRKIEKRKKELKIKRVRQKGRGREKKTIKNSEKERLRKGIQKGSLF